MSSTSSLAAVMDRYAGKVAIARVHGGLVDSRFFQSYEQLLKPKGTLPVVVERLHVDRARNEVVDMLLHPEKPRLPANPNGVNPAYGQATHVLFIDDDMVVPPDGLLRLLAHNEPLVGGLYFGRQPPHLPVAYRYVDDGQWIPVTNYARGLQVVDAIGFGFMLVAREVLEKMERPWFEFSDKMGEDMYFCEQAKKLGYQVLLDGDVVCRHLTTTEVGLEHYEWHRSQGFTFQEHREDLRTLSEEIRPYRPMNRSLAARFETNERQECKER